MTFPEEEEQPRPKTAKAAPKIDRADMAAAFALERREFLKELTLASVTQVAQMVGSATFLSPAERTHWKRQADKLLNERVQKTVADAQAEAKALAEKLEAAVGQVADITETTDELTVDAEDGLVDAETLRRAHTLLTSRLTNLNKKIAAERRRIASIRSREDDPVAYLMYLERMYPQIRLTLDARHHPDIGR